jgi:hypothetical protein
MLHGYGGMGNAGDYKFKHMLKSLTNFMDIMNSMRMFYNISISSG